MDDLTMEKLRYPIGLAQIPDKIDQQQLDEWIGILERFPKRLSALTQNLTDAQLDTPYRAGGWTIRQVVHHIADSHINSYIRFKWALTEDLPTIKAYDEAKWAELNDASKAPIQISLDMIAVLHAKLVLLMKGLSRAQWEKSFIHPEDNQKVSLEQNAGKYAWHSEHHYAHIEHLMRQKGWL